MVEIINSWAQKLIIVIIMCTIIEMILPQGKNKKYIKTVIGIYVVFTIISPIMSKINTNSLNLSKYLKLEDNKTIETSAIIDTNEYIEKVYKEKLKTDIKTKVEAIDYKVEDIELSIETKDGEAYGTILQIGLKVTTKLEKEVLSNIKIEKIVIGEEKIEETSNGISGEEKEKIKKYISSVYYINEENIVIY